MSGIHDELHVFLNTARIGTLAQDNGTLSFAYSPEYLRSPDAYPLSQNLPLTDEVFHNPAVENFFSNLLPDERIRATVAMILHVSEDNTFGMLKRIGTDCAGAVSFYPAGQTPQSPSDPVYRDLSDDEAYRILDNLGQRPLDVGDEGVRISGAGSQEKLVACVRNGKISLPLYGTPSTHIIKPAIPNFPDSVFNEFFCMRLAAKCGIPAAECDILTLNGEPFYTVSRFDRETADGITVRLHQEDFCQLLNVPPKLKYQEDGGPGVEECMRRMTEIKMPAAGKLGFVRLLIFNFLTGNCDAHAKNYAVLYRNGRPSFAPAYDLLSTMVYDSIAKRFAMSIGGETRMGMLTRDHFAELARRCDLNPKLVLAELSRLAEELPRTAQALADELNASHPCSIYESIVWEIGKLCRKVLD
jgi:serine/threonine-protein kinase HipA